MDLFGRRTSKLPQSWMFRQILRISVKVCDLQRVNTYFRDYSNFVLGTRIGARLMVNKTGFYYLNSALLP